MNSVLLSRLFNNKALTHRRAVACVQDVARAKEIIGRTATLEVRLLDDGSRYC
jgi:preprotein translocase subunit SecD